MPRVYVSVRLAPDRVAEVDAIAARLELSRSDVIRRLLRDGLTVYRRTAPTTTKETP